LYYSKYIFFSSVRMCILNNFSPTYSNTYSERETKLFLTRLATVGSGGWGEIIRKKAVRCANYFSVLYAASYFVYPEYIISNVRMSAVRISKRRDFTYAGPQDLHPSYVVLENNIILKQKQWLPHAFEIREFITSPTPLWRECVNRINSRGEQNKIIIIIK